MITNLSRTSTFTPLQRGSRRVLSSLLLLAAFVAVLGAIASSRNPWIDRAEAMAARFDQVRLRHGLWNTCQWSAGGIFRCVG
jgi:hypothetical protein